MMLFDSDVLIDFLRGAQPGADRVATELERGDVTVSALTCFELHVGAHSARQQAAVETLLAAATVLPVSREIAVHGGRLFRELKGSGREIGMADCLIAATCLEHRAVLITRNRKHFERISGLELTHMVL